ncbi:MAG TPA: hypothetical protein VF517_10425 [Thermoleophilaceae bacterium]|jgi:hypothetical protein
MRRVTTAIAVAALALGAAGCDGDDPDPRADFLKQADRICLRSGVRPKALPNDNRQAAKLLGEEARLRAAVHLKLRALEVPAELRADYARFLRLTGEVASALRRMAAVARGDEPARLAELGRRATLVEEERMRLAERIGFRRCGRPITEPVRSESP